MTPQPDAAPLPTEAERRRALGAAYAHLLSLAAKRRAQTTTEPTTTESDHANDDIRHAPRA